MGGGGFLQRWRYHRWFVLFVFVCGQRKFCILFFFFYVLYLCAFTYQFYQSYVRDFDAVCVCSQQLISGWQLRIRLLRGSKDAEHASEPAPACNYRLQSTCPRRIGDVGYIMYMYLHPSLASDAAPPFSSMERCVEGMYGWMDEASCCKFLVEGGFSRSRR